jgi:hypothetical protein
LFFADPAAIECQQIKNVPLSPLREEIRAESEALLGKYGGGLVPEKKPSVA